VKIFSFALLIHILSAALIQGQVIIDKNPGVSCVVNKTNMIDNTYRNFKMELLAGEENMVAKVGETSNNTTLLV
jgi:tRNA (guanine37-N1)-methyltransferase